MAQIIAENIIINIVFSFDFEKSDLEIYVIKKKKKGELLTIWMAEQGSKTYDFQLIHSFVSYANNIFHN